MAAARLLPQSDHYPQYQRKRNIISCKNTYELPVVRCADY
jgi:hypothetical protein